MRSHEFVAESTILNEGWIRDLGLAILIVAAIDGEFRRMLFPDDISKQEAQQIGSTMTSDEIARHNQRIINQAKKPKVDVDYAIPAGYDPEMPNYPYSYYYFYVTTNVDATVRLIAYDKNGRVIGTTESFVEAPADKIVINVNRNKLASYNLIVK